MTQNSNPPVLTVDQAHQLLKPFDCTNPNLSNTVDSATLQSAILVLVQHADYYILGVCADNISQGYTTLLQYGQAFGDRIEHPCPDHSGPVYLKYNTRSGLFHVDRYTGSHRGILVSCQSAYDQGANDLYGHLPLNLFAKPLFAEPPVAEPPVD
ncbi:MAG: DUF1824 family protein [Leptolyngbyaceae bacterium]|nr:DUF1824 family protein [Leptolyngbyaceae bacterium]